LRRLPNTVPVAFLALLSCVPICQYEWVGIPTQVSNEERHALGHQGHKGDVAR